LALQWGNIALENDAYRSLKFGEGVTRIEEVLGPSARTANTQMKEFPMFSARRISLHTAPRLYTPPSPPTAARRRAISALRAVLIVAVTSLSVFTAGRIFLTGVPLGGARDLLTLYGATAALALGLAGLFELRVSDDESDGADRGGRGKVSNRVSGVFRRTRDQGFRFLSKAMRLTQVG
jgi:hypothetical protein